MRQLMTIDELADKLLDKSSEVYWEDCSEDVEDDKGYVRKRYWEGWSDALEWVAKSIRDGWLEGFELTRPIPIGERYIDGKSETCWRYPPNWSEEQIDEWRRGDA